jgi:hypothetical protein
MAFQRYAQRLKFRWQGCGDWISQGRTTRSQNQTSQ